MIEAAQDIAYQLQDDKTNVVLWEKAGPKGKKIKKMLEFYPAETPENWINILVDVTDNRLYFLDEVEEYEGGYTMPAEAEVRVEDESQDAHTASVAKNIETR